MAVIPVGVLAVGAAAAAPSAPGQSCVAPRHSLSRIAANATQPADCCTGRMQCAQFLSTITVLRPVADHHT